MRICIDARLISGRSGGVEQAVIGLAYGLSNLDDGNEKYYFLTYKGFDAWLRPFIYGGCHIVSVPAPIKRMDKGKNLVGRNVSKWFRRTWDEFGPLIAGQRSIRPLPISDGTVEKLGFDVIHFTIQRAFYTKIPSIYQPWDLQHRHLPELFSRRERLGRDIMLNGFCQQASVIAVASNWIKEDLIKQYKLPGNKIVVIPMAPPLTAYSEPVAEQLMATQQQYSLPNEFLLYPAQTFKHKNHISLMYALAQLRDELGLIIHLVCTGRINEYFSEIRAVAEMLQLGDQVRFLDFINADDLYSLYKLAKALVFPTRYEGWGFPLGEAFVAGVPVACANVTTLPEQAGDAALLFDPDNINSIAGAIYRLWTDEQLRKQLITKGRKRVQIYSWNKSARMFRAQYRLLGGRDFNHDDRKILIS